jgi:pyruvyltransferase
MNEIRLFWWNEIKLMSKPKENFGDLLGKYLVEKISGRNVVWVHPKKWHFKNYFQPIYFTVGSILAHVTKKCVVWGSGVILKNQVVQPATFLAVRGPQTRKVLLQQGYTVPEIYGDPGLLLPLYYAPKVDKKYKWGIIPHYNDFKIVYSLYKNEKDFLIIDLMTNAIEPTTDLFLQCERIVSSSLHGLIVAHAYNIPAVWVQFSGRLFGDGIKFQDYFESVDMEPYIPEIISRQLNESELNQLFKFHPFIPKKGKITELQKGLMEICPFKEV